MRFNDLCENCQHFYSLFICVKAVDCTSSCLTCHKIHNEKIMSIEDFSEIIKDTIFTKGYCEDCIKKIKGGG